MIYLGSIKMMLIRVNVEQCLKQRILFDNNWFDLKN